MTSPHAAAPADGLVEVPPSHHDAIRLGDPRYQSDPADVFRRLRREHGAVAPVLLDGDVPAWLVLGHRELQHVATDTATFGRSSRHWRLARQLPASWPLWPMMGGGPACDSLLYTEGEAHRHRAGAMSDALRSIDGIEFKARCEAFSEELLDRFATVGEADLMSGYAMMLPVLALGWALGVPADRGPALVDAFTAVLGGGADAITGQQQAREAMTTLSRHARARPGANVASRLVTHPAGLTDQQIVEDLIVLIVAGHQATSYWIGNALRLMLTDRRYTNTLNRGQLPVSHALREVLWDDTPTQIFAGRWTTRAVDLAGVRIPAGDLVLLGLAAANTDPDIRPDPATGLRGSRAYLSYSHGPHGCPDPAHDIAESIAVAAIEVLLDRLPDLRLACPAEELRWQPSVWMRGLQTLPVHFTPTPPTLSGGFPWI